MDDMPGRSSPCWRYRGSTWSARLISLWHGIRRRARNTYEQWEDRIRVESPSIQENVV
jgi:hypothetical protein